MDPEKANGAGTLYRDSKFGVLVGAVVTAAGQAVVEWLGELDFSNAPRLVASIAPILVGALAGLITSKVAKRR